MPEDRTVTYPADAMQRIADRLCDIDYNLPADEARDYALDIVLEVTAAVDKLRASETRATHIDMDALARSMSDQIADLQMALRVVRELIDQGPGTPGQLAERMTEKDEDGTTYDEDHVADAVGVLDQWSLLSHPDEDLDSEVVELWS